MDQILSHPNLAFIFLTNPDSPWELLFFIVLSSDCKIFENFSSYVSASPYKNVHIYKVTSITSQIYVQFR